MAPPTSLAWNYFTVREYGMAECHLCHKFIRFIRNTSPLIAHLRCKHPEVLTREKSGSAEEEDFDAAQQVKEEPVVTKEYEMNLRMREMMALRLEDAMGDAHARNSTNPMAQLLRSLCESSLWLIRDWPSQKMDDVDAVRASRLETMARLRQLLRTRPPKNSEMDSLILLLADAMLTISEQWPGGETPVKPKKEVVATLSVQRTQKSTPTLVREAYSAPGSRPPVAKQQRLGTPGSQQLSPFSAQRKQQMLQAVNAGSPYRLWTFFTKTLSEPGVLLATCAICNKTIPRHNNCTSNMKNHLKSNHPAEYASLGIQIAVSNEKGESSFSIVRPEGEEEEEDETALAGHSATHNDHSSLQTSSSPLFFDDSLVKEEEMEFDEEPLDPFFDKDNHDEPSSSQSFSTSQPSSSKVTNQKGGSDIWSYFRKEEGNGEKHGCCTLCDWRRKIYNHGTNTMWSHLRRAHPFEHSVLKPQEYNRPVHGLPTIPVGMPIPSHLTLPKPPTS